ncbi:MAG TPA: glycine cleavage system protein GcvH [Actinobacteria bacterium]|nr:glycine cleavage system protein GcvH [Actinomycetota bacterium]
MSVPDDRRYTDQHEWALRVGDIIRIGITDYAQDALGDVVFVDLPAVGKKVAAGDTLAEVESTKSVAEVYAPCAGEVRAVNAALADAPERINEDPYGEGWFVELTPDDITAVDGLLDAAAYRALIG